MALSSDESNDGITASPDDKSSQGESSQTKLLEELWASSELLFQSKIAWLLSFGPIALLGEATGMLGEAGCFACSGIALIPCAERLSFVTEQVAEHTNGTIGALLNATFGNAPELLIATAALRSGFYRVVQLTMLGSMLTNLLFVFGISCLIGGLRWQVQELRITSGNVSVGMLLVSTAASLLPAALIQGGQITQSEAEKAAAKTLAAGAAIPPSHEELCFSRINAFVLMTLYLCFLIFQLGTHKGEFDDHDESSASTSEGGSKTKTKSRRKHRRSNRRNKFCLPVFKRFCDEPVTKSDKKRSSQLGAEDLGHVELSKRDHFRTTKDRNSDKDLSKFEDADNGGDEWSDEGAGFSSDFSSSNEVESLLDHDPFNTGHKKGRRTVRRKIRRAQSGRESSDYKVDLLSSDGGGGPSAHSKPQQDNDDDEDEGPLMSLRVGIIWLFIITLCVSALSDMIVDSIDGFAIRMKISSVFTSMVIVPFFSNVAEQVSAILFAFRNEMDLCVGVTVGSAIQVAAFVLPGSVLIGMVVDRSMSLYFHAYETVCLFLGVVTVAAILQGGTTNWLVGAMLVGMYIMIAAGFWFHEMEDLAVDAETIFQNVTAA